jgi:MYND finger
MKFLAGKWMKIFFLQELIFAATMSEEAKKRGNALYKADDKEGAAAAFAEAILLSPEDEVLYANRAAILCQMPSRLDDAVADANECIRLKPEWSRGHARLALALEKGKHYEKALDSYRHAAELQPDDNAVHKAIERVQRRLVEQESEKAQENDENECSDDDGSFLPILGKICGCCGVRKQVDQFSGAERQKDQDDVSVRCVQCQLGALAALRSDKCTRCGAGSSTKKCSRCAKHGVAVRYCSAACQQNDWPAHRHLCDGKHALSADDFEFVAMFHGHVQERNGGGALSADGERQRRRSTLLSEALGGNVLFYAVENVKTMRAAKFPLAPRLIRNGQVLRVRFADERARQLAKDEGWPDIVFEYSEPEVTAMNLHLLLDTNILSPRQPIDAFGRSPYAFGGPHLLLGVFSPFFSMIVQWLTHKAALYLPRARNARRKLDDDNLTMDRWRQMSDDWSSIFAIAVAKPNAVLCMWHNTSSSEAGGCPNAGDDAEQPCPFFHKELDQRAMVKPTPIDLPSGFQASSSSGNESSAIASSSSST